LVQILGAQTQLRGSRFDAAQQTSFHHLLLSMIRWPKKTIFSPS
jgi:hypothetical protein